MASGAIDGHGHSAERPARARGVEQTLSKSPSVALRVALPSCGSQPQQPRRVLPADELALMLADRRRLDEAGGFEALFQRIVDREHHALGPKRRDGALECFRLAGARGGGEEV